MLRWHLVLLQGYMVRTMFRAISTSLDKAAGSLVLVSVWLLGEYGDILVSGSAPLLPEEEPLKASGSDVVRLLEVLLGMDPGDTEIREYIMTAVRPNGPLHLPRLSRSTRVRSLPRCRHSLLLVFGSFALHFGGESSPP